MLSARRSLLQNFASAPLLPRVPELQALYAPSIDLRLRQGTVTMIAGRPGSQKSGFALFWARQLGLPTLYFSADMTPFEASTRLASMELRRSVQLVEQTPIDEVAAALRGSNIQFSFETPITWHQIEEELEAYVEVSNAYPKLIILDNLMDFEGGESDYSAQMQTMQEITAMARDTGATVFVLHHTTDNSPLPANQPQPRKEIKNKLGEKPQQVLTVALDAATNAFRVAVVKQRSGRQNPDADPRYLAFLRAYPEYTSFETEGTSGTNR